MDGQGNLERTWKVGEKSGNLKINGYGRQSPELFYSVQAGKGDSLSPSPSSLRATPKGKNSLPWGANFSF